MIPIIYHTGLTPPPVVNADGFKVCHYSALKVEYESSNAPYDISEFLQLDPIILMMSKNAVIGLDKWLSHYGLQADFFADIDFWTVGDRTHACLHEVLKTQSFYPKEMTGKGVLQALQGKGHSSILLISGQSPREEFIASLSSAGINFFHFAVYKTICEENAEFSANFTNSESNYLIITSPSAIGGILKSLSLSNLSQMKSRIISIGPTTSEAIHQNGGDIFLESEVQNINILYKNLCHLILELSHP